VQSGFGNAYGEAQKPVSRSRFKCAAVAKTYRLLTQRTIDAVGEHHNAVRTFSIRQPGVGVVVDESVHPKNFIAVSVCSTQRGAVILRGALTKLGDGKLDIRFALADACVGAHQS